MTVMFNDVWQGKVSSFYIRFGEYKFINRYVRNETFVPPFGLLMVSVVFLLTHLSGA